MGIHKEVRKIFGSTVLNYIISARTAQGFEEYKTSTLQDRQEIINRWREHKDEYQSSKQKLHETGRPEGQDSGHLSTRGFLQAIHLSFEEQKKLHEERRATREAERQKAQSKDGRRNCPFCRRSNPHTHPPVQENSIALDATRSAPEGPSLELEHAIHASVAATSCGDAEEDMIIERAIRASIAELQKSGDINLDDSKALDRAIRASVAEASRRLSNEDHEDHGPIIMTDEDMEHEALLEKAIHESLSQYQLPSQSANADGDIDTDDDEDVKLAIENSKETTASADVDTDEDENFRLAIEKSKEIPPEADMDTDDDEDVKLALERSKSEHLKELTRAQTEEEIVLEYIKKQSLAEEAHKRKVSGKQKEGPSDADEEALKQAIEESLKAFGGGSATGEASGSSW